ncbi:conserved hypothetical protein [Histoplasma capsulatum var. duboisii H88]|uniref:Uncharacterized protein n=1 Tax=Ajellomyces capsulatus (strain H88) TaxID=544711 RepID=F0UF10_AJEC8|nr:conserved hypothetical protein [Histoplasma capsulatum var. duboisii H88]
MTSLKRKLGRNSESGSAYGADSPQGEYYCQELNGEYRLLTAGHPVSSSTSSLSRSRGASLGGLRSRARGKGRARIGRSKSLNGSTHDEPLPSQSHSDPPQTPRAKRARKAKEEIAPENGISESSTPRPTRQSARILSKFHHMSSVPEELDDLAIQQPDFNRPLDIHIGSDELEANEDDASSKSPSTVTRKSDSQSISLRSTWTDSSRPRRSSGYKTELETSPEEVPKPQSKFVEANTEKNKNPATKPDVRPASKQASHVVTRKRNSASKRDESAEVLNNMEMSTANSGLDSPPSERVEDDRIGGDDMEIIAPEARRPWPLPRLRTRNADSPARLTELESSLRAGESTPTEISDSRAATPSETGELSAGPLSTLPSRGRGRGGFRGRARGRGWTRGRGRGGRGRGAGRGGRGGRLQPIDREMSLSPSPVIKQLRDRQKELDKVFRRVAAAQRTALTVIANRSESKLIKDPNAHMAVPEYDQVMNGLKARMRKRLEIIENEYNWRKKSADAMLEANKELVNSNFHDKSWHVRKEHLLAAQGSYMAFVEQRRQAEDEDHTEVSLQLFRYGQFRTWKRIIY